MQRYNPSEIKWYLEGLWNYTIKQLLKEKEEKKYQCISCGKKLTNEHFSRCTECLDKATGHSGNGNF
jgi:hypothetical protein